MANTEKLNEIIDSLGLKKNYLASKIGLSRQGFANKVNNRNGAVFNAREIKVLCELLHITSLKERETIFFADKVE